MRAEGRPPASVGLDARTWRPGLLVGPARVVRGHFCPALLFMRNMPASCARPISQQSGGAIYNKLGHDKSGMGRRWECPICVVTRPKPRKGKEKHRAEIGLTTDEHRWTRIGIDLKTRRFFLYPCLSVFICGFIGLPDLRAARSLSELDADRCPAARALRQRPTVADFARFQRPGAERGLGGVDA